jgi:hypothetical protein
MIRTLAVEVSQSSFKFNDVEMGPIADLEKTAEAEATFAPRPAPGARRQRQELRRLE